MSLSDVCIRRPVFTWVLVAVPVVLGVVAYFELGVDLFPKVDFPVISVSAALPGASAEEMESAVTKPLEEALNTISGIDELRSITREGNSTLIIRFLLEKDGDVGAQEARDKISSVFRQLPDGMETPLVNKFDLDAAPIMTIGVSGRRDIREVTEIAKHQIQELLQTVPGVGNVFLTGGRSRAINVRVDTDRLRAYGVSIEEVRQSLVSQNMEVPGGIVDQGQREMVLRTLGRISSSDKFNDLIVANPPYIALSEMAALSPEVRLWEPRAALTDEGDGLGAYRAILNGITQHMTEGGRLLMEIGPTQAEEVSVLVLTAGFSMVDVIQDLDGRDRIVMAIQPEIPF